MSELPSTQIQPNRFERQMNRWVGQLRQEPGVSPAVEGGNLIAQVVTRAAENYPPFMQWNPRSRKLFGELVVFMPAQLGLLAAAGGYFMFGPEAGRVGMVGVSGYLLTLLGVGLASRGVNRIRRFLTPIDYR